VRDSSIVSARDLGSRKASNLMPRPQRVIPLWRLRRGGRGRRLGGGRGGRRARLSRRRARSGRRRAAAGRGGRFWPARSGIGFLRQLGRARRLGRRGVRGRRRRRGGGRCSRRVAGRQRRGPRRHDDEGRCLHGGRALRGHREGARRRVVSRWIAPPSREVERERAREDRARDAEGEREARARGRERRARGDARRRRRSGGRVLP
jgi:hypothetical protein